MTVRTADLVSAGWSSRRISAAVAGGALVKLRGGAYCAPDVDAGCVAAGRVHGRLTCLSELRRLGVFVRERPGVHVHIPASGSRLPPIPPGHRVHRRRLHRTPHPRAMSVEVFDALVQSVRCQDPRSAVATLDSALNRGLLRPDEVDELFAALPRRFRRLQALLDPLAESGPETFVRLMLRGLGCRPEAQVEIPGVGRVDFVVGGILIIECDSRAHHSSWESQLADRRRDLTAASLGYFVIRLVAEDILWNVEAVQQALRGALARVRTVRMTG
jgi:very-short-patch-repair endonuclease